MTLPRKLAEIVLIVNGLSVIQLKTWILNRRIAIRYHRDQKGDDRCWLDDGLVHCFIGGVVILTKLSSFEVAMVMCRNYYHHRSATYADTAPDDAIINPNLWDADLATASREELISILTNLQHAIVEHDQAPFPRTIEHDRKLYLALPEKLPADFRLPGVEAFLGYELAPHAGCPSFINSHEACNGTCNLRQWGPCKPVLVT